MNSLGWKSSSSHCLLSLLSGISKEYCPPSLSSVSSLSSFALAELERAGDWVRSISFSSCVPFNLSEIGSVGTLVNSVGVGIGAKDFAFRVGAAVGGIVFGNVGVVVGAKDFAFRVGAAVGDTVFCDRLDGRSDGVNVDFGSVGMMVSALALALIMLLLLLGAVVTTSGLKEIESPAKASSVTGDSVGRVVSTEGIGSLEILELIEVSVFVSFRVII